LDANNLRKNPCAIWGIDVLRAPEDFAINPADLRPFLTPDLRSPFRTTRSATPKVIFWQVNFLCIIVEMIHNQDKYRAVAAHAGADGFVTKLEFTTALILLIRQFSRSLVI
jgi:hypothetical protein